MDTYTAVKIRLLELCDKNRMSIHKLALVSAVSPSTIKNILYGKSKNPGVVTIKMLCDGLGITLQDFFDAPVFYQLEQEIK
ncbi:MAG: helix-turn-helix transcriptional regulator [Ruminococcaceae bacterium]|nr:helix-turn-helix transcriptional regulator [Oscillospiraceae bacterium]MBQ3195693.1 helix-turn-helix transcriptional regulator [Clostridia bacterium]MBR6593761.1 helix-turn-helix transcriptional regulator [Clostridia bacterium]